MSFFKYWKQDFQSSIVVFLIALPLCLGIALASNAPLSAGLFAGIIGGLVIGAASGSPISVSGPAAGLTVIVASSIQTLGSFEAFALAVFLSGLLQIIFSLLRGGAIGDYFPSSVIKGMLAAIGLILILKQFPHAVGYDSDFMGDESFEEATGGNTFLTFIGAFRFFHPGALVISLIAMAIMLYWDKKAISGSVFFKSLPGPLVAVLSGIVLNKIFHIFLPDIALHPEQLVNLPFEGGLNDIVQGIKLPDWNFLSHPQIYSVALTIAIVGSLESLLSVDAADKIDQDGRFTDKNRELFAQGLGNTLSGFVGGLPITAVIVRTSANANAGAKSKFSGILHGVWLLLSVIFIPHFLNTIPLSALAAMLMLVGYKLVKPELIKKTYLKGMNQFIPFVLTIIAILLTNLLVGILIGMVVGFVFVLRSNIHNSIVMVDDKENYLIRFYKDVSFLQKSRLQRLLNSVPEGATVILDGSTSVFVDEDIIDVIEDFMRRNSGTGIKVILKKSSLALSPMFRE